MGIENLRRFARAWHSGIPIVTIKASRYRKETSCEQRGQIEKLAVLGSANPVIASARAAHGPWIDGNVAIGGERADFDEPCAFFGRAHLANFCEVVFQASEAIVGVFLKLVGVFLFMAVIGSIALAGANSR